MANKEEEKILKITVRYDDALEGIKKYKQELKDLQKEENNLKETDEDYAEQLELINAKRKETNAEIRVLRKEIQNNIKIQREQEGSLKQLRAALSNATKEYDELSRAEREKGKRGQELREEIKQITKELKGAEEETQRFYRNVGNYKNSIVEALGLNQGFAGSLMSMADGAEDAGGMLDNMVSSTKAFGASLKALLTNPVFLSIAGIAGVGVAFKWWYDYNKGVEEATRKTRALFGEMNVGELRELRVEIQTIADLYNKEFADVLQTVNALAKQFGITGKEATDLIAQGFALDADVSGEFLEQVREYAAQFKAAGLSAQEFVAITTSASKQGVFSDKALDSIKEAQLRIGEMSDATRDALEGLGIDVDALTEDLEKGKIKIMDVINLVSLRLSELEPTSQAARKAVADVFGGAGEDAGVDFLRSIHLLTTSLDELKAKESEYVETNMALYESARKLNMQIEMLFGGSGGFYKMSADLRIFTNDVLGVLINTLTTVGLLLDAMAISLISVFRALYDLISLDFQKLMDNWMEGSNRVNADLTGIYNAWAGIEAETKKATNAVNDYAESVSNAQSLVQSSSMKTVSRWIEASNAEDISGIRSDISRLERIKKFYDDDKQYTIMLERAIKERQDKLAQLLRKGQAEAERIAKEEYEQRKDEIEKKAELIEKELEVVSMSIERRYQLKLEMYDAERELEVLRINEEYRNEEQRQQALYLLDLEYKEKRVQVEKDMQAEKKAAYDAQVDAMVANLERVDEAVINQVESEKKLADEEVKTQKEKTAALTTLAGNLSDLAFQAAEDNKHLAKLAKGLAIAEILIAQGVAIANAVKKATTSGATVWDIIGAIGTVVGVVTSVISTAMKSVNSAKVDGAGGSGSGGGGGNVYQSSAMFNPMLAQLNSVGDNMMPYESKVRDEDLSEEMMADAVAKGVQGQPAPVVSVVEITEAQKRVKAIESMGDV